MASSGPGSTVISGRYGRGAPRLVYRSKTALQFSMGLYVGFETFANRFLVAEVYSQVDQSADVLHARSPD